MRKFIFITLALLASFTLVQINRINWNVLTAHQEQVDLRKIHSPSIAVFLPANSSIWPSVFAINQIAAQFNRVEGKIAIVLPMSVPMILENAQSVQKRYSLNMNIYLAPDRLWKKMFGVKGGRVDLQKSLTPKYAFIKNGRVIRTIDSQPNWFSAEGVDLINDIFGTNMRLVPLPVKTTENAHL